VDFREARTCHQEDRQQLLSKLLALVVGQGQDLLLERLDLRGVHPSRS